MLRHAKPILPVTPVADLEALAARPARPLDGVRLLICGSAEIVPQALLDLFPRHPTLQYPSRNIHPGPPERLGRYRSVWVLLRGRRHLRRHVAAARLLHHRRRLGVPSLFGALSFWMPATALANVGPGLKPGARRAKWALDAGVIFGRLEFETVFVMLTVHFWRD